MENVQKCSENKISSKQKKAIEMLIYQGLSKSEVAKALNIAPQTLSRWLNSGKSPAFVKAFEKELSEADIMRKNNYRVMAQKAQDKLIELLECSDKQVAFRACKDLLDRAGDKPEDNMRMKDAREPDEEEDDSSFVDALNEKAGVWNEENEETQTV